MNVKVVAGDGGGAVGTVLLVMICRSMWSSFPFPVYFVLVFLVTVRMPIFFFLIQSNGSRKIKGVLCALIFS